MRAVIVVPTIREDSIHRFLEAWDREFADHPVLVVEDNPVRSFALGGRDNVEHYSWEQVDRVMGSDAYLIPRRTDCIRSFGFLEALRYEPDMIVTLDDDCYPGSPNFLETHFANLEGDGARHSAWVSTIAGAKPRGMPYYNTTRASKVAISHGLWSNVPDLDAPTQLAVDLAGGVEVQLIDQPIPVGSYFPMCGMNLAFRPELLPCMYFLQMGQAQPYDRFGDIWCGILAKKICDHLGFGVWSGAPVVVHERASDVWTNLRKEGPGLEANEQVWQAVDRVVLTGTTVADCYMELAQKLDFADEYWSFLRDCMIRWAKSF